MRVGAGLVADRLVRRDGRGDDEGAVALQEMRDERDAIEHVRELLLQGRHVSEDDLKAIDKDIKDIVNDSAEFAKESPSPDVRDVGNFVYTEMA